MGKKPRNNPKVLDLISNLPDPILLFIISHLSIREVFRTSLLSKRWKHLWRNVSHFDFDYDGMVNLDEIGKKRVTKKDVRKYVQIVKNTLQQHKGDLISCSFKHFHWCLDFGYLNTWIEFCVERKNLSSLSLYCDRQYTVEKDYFKPNLFSNLNSLELTNYRLEDSILPAFESCKKLEILKLENVFMEDTIINGILKFCFGLEKFSLINSQGFNSIKIENKSLRTLELIWLNVQEIDVNVEELQNLVIDSLICPPKSLRIYSPNLRTFYCIRKFYPPPKSLRAYSENLQTLIYICEPFDQKSQDPLTTQDILENCSDLFESQSINIFQNLWTLSIELDLNNIREALALSYVLNNCNHLNTLKITIPINETSSFDDCALPFPKSMFWETRDIYFEFFEKLKFVTLKGFSGKEQEVLFANFLISRGYKMEKMYVICDSTIVDEAKDLLSLTKVSRDLSIILK